LGITETASRSGRQEPPKEEMRHPKSGSAVAELVDNIVEYHTKCKCFLQFSEEKPRKMVMLQNCHISRIDRFLTTVYNAVVDKKLYCENATGGNE
jgi:hypothetical protein